MEQSSPLGLVVGAPHQCPTETGVLGGIFLCVFPTVFPDMFPLSANSILITVRTKHSSGLIGQEQRGETLDIKNVGPQSIPPTLDGFQ